MEKSRPEEGQATGHNPETSVVQPRVNLPTDELGQGKIVDTDWNQSTGHINTPGTYTEYK